jgi:HEAT repeat protein
MTQPVIKRNWHIVGGVALGILALWFTAGIILGPRFEGHTADHWVNELVRNQRAARGALDALGPDAVPALTRAVEQKQSRLTPLLYSLRPKLPAAIGRRLPSPHEAAIRSERAVEVLYDLGTNAAPAVPALIRADFSRESWEFNYAHAALTRIGAAGIPQFIRVLRSPDSRERVAAARYLGLIGPPAGSAATALARTLHDPYPLVRTEAIGALAQVGPAARDAVPALKAALESADMESRLRLIEALWRIDRESDSTVPQLIQVLQDPASPHRAKAATLLALMGPAARAARPALVRVLREDFSYTRVKAQEALEQIGPDGSEEAARR